MPNCAAQLMYPKDNQQMGLTRRAVCNMQVGLACMFAFSNPAFAADYYICWMGAAGYSLTGKMTIPDAATRKDMVTERNVTAFEITGYRNGVRIGGWNLANKGPDTTWLLRFEPQTLNFPVGGDFGSLVSQGWNANGAVNDCGKPGFGFNSGNYAQDVCVNGVYIRASSIDPDTPLKASLVPYSVDCRADIPLS